MLDILVHCPSFRVWGPSVRYAADLATSLGASLTGIYVGAPIPAKAPDDVPVPLLSEFVACAQDDTESAIAAREQFESHCRDLGLRSAHWQVALGDTAEILCAAGSWNDLLVIERGDRETEESVGLINDVLLSGLACVVVPEATYALPRIERIAVAWNGSSSATRAIHTAMPLLQSALHVLLLRGKGGDPGYIRCKPAFDPECELRARGIQVRTQWVDAGEDDVGAVLLEAASRHRADLLVMGAYGRKRLGQWYIGGTTRHVLQYADIPLFLQH